MYVDIHYIHVKGMYKITPARQTLPLK